MRWFYCFSAFFCVCLLSGCSLVFTGEYLSAQLADDAVSVKREDWLTDSGEPSFGALRPPLKRIVWDESENTSTIIYPIIIQERAISFGPAFLPVIPVFDSWQDPPSEYTRKIRLLYEGADDVATGLKITVDGNPVSTRMHEDDAGNVFIVSDVLNTQAGKMAVTVTFKDISQTFHFETEKTRCFIPFTSFN